MVPKFIPVIRVYDTSWFDSLFHVGFYTISRVSNQLSDGLIFGHLFHGKGKVFCISILRQIVDLLAYYLQSKDELGVVSLHGTTG